jgi:hypothetical protein
MGFAPIQWEFAGFDESLVEISQGLQSPHSNAVQKPLRAGDFFGEDFL